MFNLLEPSNEWRKRSGKAFFWGLLVESLVVGATGFLGLVFPDQLPVTMRHGSVAWLALTRPPAKPALRAPGKLVRVIIPRLKPAEILEPTPPHLADRAVRKIQPRASPAAVPVPAPLPAVPIIQPRHAPKVEIAVKTGLFGGAPDMVTTKNPAEQVRTGGFGSPQGISGRAQGDSSGNVPKLGSFALPEGPDVGNGTGGVHGIRGEVASAGFSSAKASPGLDREPGRGKDPGVAVGGFGGTSQGAQSQAVRPEVAMGGFAKIAPVPLSPAEKSPVPRPTVFQPVEIFSKPSPVYTEEARRLGIQGEVTLSVVFESTGSVKVIRVIKSLGYGLDQAAEQAAARIRFKPARYDGKPSDFPATLRIEFRLAGQSS